jgi:hypothetical protein
MRARGLSTLMALLGALAIAACGSSGSTSSASVASAPAATASSTATNPTTSSSSSVLGYEGVPLEQGPAIAPAGTTQTGTVDGIHCAPVEQLAYHIHAHLAVFVNGRVYSVPAGVGIPGAVTQQTPQGPVVGTGQCFYWLHTHTDDGVIHIESPTQRIYTLGDFFDEWHQPLTASQVGTLHGAITAFENGKQWKKNVRDIPLTPHADIQLNIGEPAPPLVTVNWSRTSL